MPIGLILFNLTAIYLWVVSVSVFSMFKKEQTVFLRDFTGFIFGITGASTFWAISTWFILKESNIAGYFHPLAMMVGGIGFLFLAHLALTFLAKPKIQKIILTFFIILFIIFLPVSWSNIPSPSFSSEGVVFWNIEFSSGITAVLFGIFLTLLPVIIFVYLGLQSKERFIKTRSYFIAAGILFYMIGGLSHNLGLSVSYSIIAHCLTFLGATTLLVGVVHLRKIYEKKI